MTEDTLTKEKLSKYIGKNRFDTEEEFRDFIKPHIRETLAIPKERLGGQPAGWGYDDSRYDIYILDKETLLEPVMVVGLKVERKYPHFTGDDIEKFNTFCIDRQIRYSALISESEFRFFRYIKSEAMVIPEEMETLPPLNHIDYEFSKTINKERILDYVKSRKSVFIAIGFVLLVVMLVKMMTVAFCSSGGAVKAVVRDGKKIYFMPSSSSYGSISGNKSGETRFCTQQGAESEGYVNSDKE